MMSYDFHRPLVLRDRSITPRLLLAPLAGVTNSAFRRLVADFGGYGLLTTEMLSGTAMLGEALGRSPYTRRRPQEGNVVYQLRLAAGDPIEEIVARAAKCDPFALDINLGCPAPEIVKMKSGAALFRDHAALAGVLRQVRACWPGILTVKCRLGDDTPQWKELLALKMRLFEDEGIDGVTVHPRFLDEKLRRRARWELFPWICTLTRLPVVANGDISSPDDICSHEDWFAPAAAIMIGRMVVVRPWFFAELSGLPVAVDYCEVWQRYYMYVMEDFTPDKAIGRIKEFTSYYARNFFFGHKLHAGVLGSTSCEMAHERAVAFLEQKPQVVAAPSLAQI